MKTTPNASSSWDNTGPLFKVNTGILLLVNIVFGLLGLFLNSVVIISLLTSKLGKKLCYFMILILSCFDLALVVVVHPLLVIDALELYSIEFYYVESLTSFSLTALFTMTVERYLALVYSFFHHKYITKSKLIVTFQFLLIPFIIPYVVFRRKQAQSYVKWYFIALRTGILLIMFILNRQIYSVVEKLRRRANVPLGNLAECEQQNIAKKRKVTLGKVSTCLLAVLCNSLCYFPILILFGVELSQEQEGSVVPLRIESSWIFHWAQTLLAMNSTLNSLIFFYKNSVLRRRGNEVIAKGFFVFKKLLHCQ